jgi:hypothetical protein
MHKLNFLIFLFWSFVLAVDVALLTDEKPSNDPWPFLIGLHVFLCLIYLPLTIMSLFKEYECSIRRKERRATKRVERK